MSGGVTDWFAADVKPVREGWYEREYHSEWLTKFCDWWDGSHWILCTCFGDHIGPSNDERRWRGLSAPATQPTKGAKE